MLGDVLLIKNEHKIAAKEIAGIMLKTRKNKMIVAISGESGSGKSELSHCLARELKLAGIRTKVLHADNYYKTHPLERPEWRKKHGIDSIGLDEYDWKALEENITDFKFGNTSRMPCIDIVTEQVDSLETDFSEIEMLVLDGLYAINLQEADLRVFIELTYHETKKAQLSRGKEPQNEFRMQVLEREHIVVQSLRKKADMLINKDYLLV